MKSKKGANLERAHQCLINRHHRAGVVELSAVVRSREESDQLTLRKELVSILDHLKIGTIEQYFTFSMIFPKIYHLTQQPYVSRIK